MSEIALWGVHIAGWFAASVVGARWLADHWGHCNGRSVDGRRRIMDGSKSSFRDNCLDWHGEGCWRADGEITLPRFAAASGLALVWPLLILPAMAWRIANKRPTVVGLQRDIARLEQEAGIR